MRLFIFIAFLVSVSSSAFGEESQAPSSVKPVASPEEKKEKPKAKVKKQEGAALIPLDPWIVKRTRKVPQRKKVIDQDKLREKEAEEVEKNQVKLIQEEKRVYKSLLESYEYDSKKDKKAEETINRIFKKTVLRKDYNKRILRAARVQRQVKREFLDKYEKLYPASQKKTLHLRLCVFDFPFMGLPKEVKKFDAKNQYRKKRIKKIWQQSLDQIVFAGCDFSLLTGLVSKTKSKAISFLKKSVTKLEKSTATTWGSGMYKGKGAGFYGYLYPSQYISEVSSEELEIAVRRGQQFEAKEFTAIPLKVNIQDKRVSPPHSIGLILFDIRNFEHPVRLVSQEERMQMAAALSEYASTAALFSKGDLFFLGHLGADATDPSYQLLRGGRILQDYVASGACARNTEGDYVCEKNKLKPRPLVLFGALADLFSPYAYRMRGKTLQAVLTAQRRSEIDVYSLAKSVRLFKPSVDLEKPFPIGTKIFGDKKMLVRLVWADALISPR